jgi:hypothetical protein
MGLLLVSIAKQRDSCCKEKAMIPSHLNGGNTSKQRSMLPEGAPRRLGRFTIEQLRARRFNIPKAALKGAVTPSRVES